MYSEKIEALQERFHTEKGQLKGIEEQLARERESLVLFEQRHINAIEVEKIIQTVAKQTQEQLEYHISGVVSMSLATVFDDPYSMIVRFVARRGKTECDLLFERNGEECNPLESSGGGPVDVASFTLKVAFLSIEKHRSRRLLIVDEPFRFVSPDLQNRCSQIIKEISEKLGLQIIMISHAENIIDSADRTFEVNIQAGISQVGVLG